jgi:RNA-directed DNA polymerase
MMHEPEKSDSCIVVMKLANDDAGATSKSVERRQGARGSTGKAHTPRTPSRTRVSPGLDRVRERARHQKKGRFTADSQHGC